MDPDQLALIVSIVAPAFAADPRLAATVALVGPQVATDHCFHDQAVVLLAAHTLAIADDGSAGGLATSMREGGLAVTFSAETGSGPLDSSSYGRELQRLNLLCYGFAAMTKVSG